MIASAPAASLGRSTHRVLWGIQIVIGLFLVIASAVPKFYGDTYAVELFTQIGAGQWSSPTPCSEWTVRDLVAHLVDECRWVPYLLDGGSPAAAGDRFAGDPLGDDPSAAWREQSAAARAALAADGALDHTVTVSYGEISARDYLWQDRKSVV